MKSPLEHEPQMVAGIGLITVRWAALETQLADLLGMALKVQQVGDEMYYSIGNFTQRIDLVESAIRGSLRNADDKETLVTLFGQIRRLWKTRNYLIHSHYVYYENLSEDGQSGHRLIGLGDKLGDHPSKRKRVHVTPENPNPRIAVVGTEPIRNRGFGYESRSMDGSVRTVPVNRGTFANHAAQLHKRGDALRALQWAIGRGDAPLRQTSQTSYGKSQPRSHPGRQSSPEPPAGE